MKLKALRKQNKLTQTQLCEKIKTKQQYYSRFETSPEKTPINTLIQLANFYNVSLDYLCDRQWNNQIGYIPEEKKEIVKLVLQLNQQNTLKTFGYVSGLLATQN